MIHTTATVDYAREIAARDEVIVDLVKAINILGRRNSELAEALRETTMEIVSLRNAVPPISLHA